VNHPNPFFNFLLLINFEIYTPTIIPIIEKLVNNNKNDHSISKLCKSPKKPISDLAAIIKSDVPMAFFIGSLVKITKAGIIKNPPPAPTIPVRRPTNIPSAAITG